MFAKLFAIASVLVVGAQAHMFLVVPKPTWTVQGKDGQSSPMAFLEGQPGFSPNPDFDGYLTSKGFKTMREFMDNPKLYRPVQGADFKCGFTKLDGEPQPIPKNDQIRTSGYTHEGPCEIWLDDTRVFAGKNCHYDVGGGFAYHKLDFSSCKDKCTMYWYWMGIRGSGAHVSWQIYKECVPLIGHGRAGASPAPKGQVPAPAPTTPSRTPKSDQISGEAKPNATDAAIPVSKCKVKGA